MKEQTANGVAVPSFERYAIISTGNKQYQAIEGKTLAIEKLDAEVGQQVTFSDVLLRKTGEETFEFGTPYLPKAVTATVIKHIRGPKVIAFKFKRRKKSRVKKGHRQHYTVVRITAI
jgi:large subunit ribosomal protein L21